MQKILFITLLLVSATYCTRQYIQCTPEEKNRKVCTLEYRPVCGVHVEEREMLPPTLSFKEFPNRCAACSDPSIQSIQLGPCSYEQKLTDNQRPATCSEEEKNTKICNRMYVPTCGIKTDRSYHQQSKQNYGNRCDACSNGADFVLDEECDQLEQKFGQNVKLCNPDDKNGRPCTRELNPVCGWFGMSRRAPQTFSTACIACTQAGVTHFTQGACK